MLNGITNGACTHTIWQLALMTFSSCCRCSCFFFFLLEEEGIEEKEREREREGEKMGEKSSLKQKRETVLIILHNYIMDATLNAAWH